MKRRRTRNGREASGNGAQPGRRSTRRAQRRFLRQDRQQQNAEGRLLLKRQEERS